MGQVRLTQKGLIILMVVLSLASFGLGYGIWKVTGAPYLSSTDSEAGKNPQEERNIKKEKLEKCGCENGVSTTGNDSCGNWCYEKDLPKEKEEKPEKVCGCQSYDNACGINCWFPGGTTQAVQAQADASCKSYIAMCNPQGTAVTYEVFAPGHRCWGKQDECKNPVGTPNCACEGGGLTGTTDRVTTTIGKTVDFCGYAYDADGIDVDNIVISVNGTAVGKATVTDACANASDPICTQYKNKKPVKWCYKFTATSEGDQVLSASWKDSKGFAGNACKATREVTTAVTQDNWIVDKNAGRVCDANQTQVSLNYAITITNSASDAKEISKIVDTLDTKVQNSYIQLQTITPTATVSGNVITWNLTGDNASFDPGETKTFKYTIVVPKSAFGSYYNKAVITPVGGDSNIEVDDTVIASCAPATGLFDSTESKLAIGVFLILVAFAYAYIDPLDTGIHRVFGKLAYKLSREGRIKRNRENFEKRVVS